MGRCFGDADTRAQTEEITLQSVGGELGQDGLVPFAVSRDYYPYLEYSTPAGYALGDARRRRISRGSPYERREIIPIAGAPDARMLARIERKIRAPSPAQRLQR